MNERYINPATDFGFKRLFGSEPNKILLIDFLNQLLPSHHHIHDLTYRQNEHPGISEEERRAIFDLQCESDTGEKFIVEFQRVRQTYFKDRTIFYSTFLLQEQALRGDWDYRLRAVYTISLLDFQLTATPSPDVVTTVQLKDQHGQVFFDKLTYIYVELPKFTKQMDELANDFERWLYLLRHLAELDGPPPGFEREPFEHLFEAAQMAKLNRTERLIYEDKLKVYRDLKNSYDTAAKEAQEAAKQARKQGLEQGLEQGRNDEKQSVARQMKADGLPFDTISRYTGLTLDEIAYLP